MSREKKDAKLLNIKLDRAVHEQLEQFCDESGMTKTLATEKILAQFFGVVLSDAFVQFLAVDVDFHLFGDTLLVGSEQIELVFVDVVHTFELCSLVNGPGQWANLDFQLLFQLVEQVKRVAAFAVHFVDENNDGCISHPTYVH